MGSHAGSRIKYRKHKWLFRLLPAALALEMLFAAAGCAAQSVESAQQSDAAGEAAAETTTDVQVNTETAQTDNGGEASVHKEITIGVSLGYTAADASDALWQSAWTALTARESETIGTILYTASDSGTQAQQLADMADTGVDAVVIAPTDAQALTDAVAALREAGIFVVSYGEDSTSLAADACVTFSQTALGESAAGSIVDAGTAGTQVLVFTDSTLTECTQRVTGFENGLSGEYTITLASSAAAGADEARQALYDWLADKTQEELDGVSAIFAANEDILLGVLRGLRIYEGIHGTVFTNLQIIVGCGSSEELLTYFSEEASGQVVTWYYADDAIETAVDLAAALVQGETVGSETVVTPVSAQPSDADN